MIEAKDLRIGDIVRYGKHIAMVQAVHANGSVCFMDGKDQMCVDAVTVNPIPLTPEIIVQNGWEFTECCKDEIGEWYEFSKDGVLPDMYYYPADGDFSAFVCSEEFYSHLKYVHQLQHILWALSLDAEIEVSNE